MDEQMKYEVIKSLADHPTPNKQRAALTLGCTVRHINRMLKGYREQGKAYFVHGNRGRKPANTISEDTRKLVVDLYRTKYYDANFEHFTELLGKHENIHISEKNMSWKDFRHYSARQKNSMTLGGSSGSFKLEGTFSAMEQNLLEFARFANAGKNTNFGLGQMDFWAKWE